MYVLPSVSACLVHARLPHVPLSRSVLRALSLACLSWPSTSATLTSHWPSSQEGMGQVWGAAVPALSQSTEGTLALDGEEGPLPQAQKIPDLSPGVPPQLSRAPSCPVDP